MRLRWFFSGAGLLILGAWIGCAKGGSGIDGNEGGGPSEGAGAGSSNSPASTGSTSTSTAAGGSSSTGSTTTGTSSTSTTSTSTTTSGSGGGGACSEMPCKLVSPQCGCGAGQECTVSPMGRSCTTAGAAAVGAVCDANTQCAPGGICVQTKVKAPIISTCDEFCDSDAECTAPGGLCVRTLNDGMGGAIPNTTMCSENCSPATNVGCPVAGTSCALGQEQMGQMRLFTLCAGAGAGTQGSSCTDSTDCSATFGCFGTPPSAICAKWCDVASPSCPPGKTCTQATINNLPIQVGNTSYGVCN